MRKYSLTSVCEDIGDEGPSTLVVQRRAPKRLRLDPQAKSMGELFEQLDARVKPGITTAQFRKLFNQCECGIITTRRAFRTHECLEVIDLTQEVSSSESA